MNKIIILTVASLLAMPSAYAVSCKSFSSQAEAQAYFNANGAKSLTVTMMVSPVSTWQVVNVVKPSTALKQLK